MQRNIHLKARLVPRVYLSLTDSSKLFCLSICCLTATLETTYWHEGLWSYHIKKPLRSVKMAFIIRRLTASSAASWGPEASSSILLWGGKRWHTEREGLKQQQQKKSDTQHSKIWSPKEDNAKQPPAGYHSTVLCLPLVMFLHFMKKLLWSLQVYPPNSCSFSAIKGHCFLRSFPLFLERTL